MQANKTVTVSGSASGGGVSNPGNKTLTITDDDVPGVTVSTTSLTVTEGSSTTYTVNLGHASQRKCDRQAVEQ